MKLGQVIDDSINRFFEELIRKKLIKNELSSHKKTELLLYNYKNFQEAIALKNEKIAEIKIDGLPEKSKGITSFGGVMGGDFICPVEKEENRIEDLEKSIQLTKKLVEMIEEVLNLIKSDEYFKVIELKYFENKTLEEISYTFNKDISTISRNRMRLINRMKIALFSDDFIKELMIG